VVTATVRIVQWYCVGVELIVVTATVEILQSYCVVLQVIAVTGTVDIVKCFCVECLMFCGYSNSRYSAMIM